MGPSLGKTQLPAKKFLEERRDFLYWLLMNRGAGPTTPSFLITENKEYILFGGDRIIVRDARS